MGFSGYKRKPFTEEHLAKLRSSHVGNKSALGHKVSDEAKKAMSVGHIGRKASAETKAKMSIAHKGVILGPVPEERKQKISDTVNAYYATDPANKMKCSHTISEELKQKNRLRQIGNKNRLGKFHSGETKLKISKSQKLLWGNPEYIKKIIESVSYTSKPEHVIAAILDELQIQYIRQHPIFNIDDAYPCDFYIRKYNLIIEVDGIYWHNFPHGTEKDQRRNIQLVNAGYNLLRIWETEVVNAKNTIVNFIKKLTMPSPAVVAEEV